LQSELAEGPRPSTWRVFCAIAVPENVLVRVSEHVSKLRAEFPTVAASWNKDRNLHLTLKFIGHIPIERVTDVSRAASMAVEKAAKFQVQVTGAGSFPKHGPPRVLWLGIEDRSGCLGQLQERLEDACAEVGFEREARRFHPHLTLARLNRPQRAKQLGQAHKRLGFTASTTAVTDLLVLRSELNPGGSKYSEISRHPLS